MTQNYLRKWRLTLKFSMQELAVKAYVSPATINTIEHYGHYPRVDTRSRIAAALGLPETLIWPSPRNGDNNGD
jgi:transcriptional regulator with XRE-family HTH domain